MRRYRAFIVFTLIALVCGAVSGLVAGNQIKGTIDHSEAVQRAALRTAQAEACRRNNVRVASQNRNGLATYRENTLFASAISKPRPHVSKRRRRLERTFHARLEDILSSLTWTPLNHRCDRRPTAVQLPIRFAERKPPLSELRSSK